MGYTPCHALLAQPDRVTGYEPVGQGFESLAARFSPRKKPGVFVLWGYVLKILTVQKIPLFQFNNKKLSFDYHILGYNYN